MKITINHIKKTKETIEKDVEFPIYIKYESSEGWRDYRNITKVNEDKTAIEILIRESYHGKPTLELQYKPKYDFNNLGTYFDGEDYEHTVTNREEFDEVLGKLKTMIAKAA